MIMFAAVAPAHIEESEGEKEGPAQGASPFVCRSIIDINCTVSETIHSLRPC